MGALSRFVRPDFLRKRHKDQDTPAVETPDTPGADALPPLFTLVPDHDPIELVAYYPEFTRYYPECELQSKRWFVDNVQDGWVIFDVGANIGYYSILFSRLAPNGEVYAFEPTATIDLLKANIAHHGCTNVRPVKIALGARSGELQENIYRIRGREAERQTYPFQTVDEVVNSLRLERLDCLKIDVDSFDFDVLRGSERTLEHFNPWLLVALNDALAKRNQSACAALEWLAARGYRKALAVDYDNFVLRREPAAKRWAGAPHIELTFDTRPVFLPPLFAKGPAVENLFSKTAVVHNSTCVRQLGGAVAVTVPGPRWSYAASWPRNAGCVVSGPLIVEVEMEVAGGAVALACLNAGYAAVVGEQPVVDPAPCRQTVAVQLGDAAPVAGLMLRNADEAGATAQVRIFAVRAFALVPAGLRRRPPLLSPAKRRLTVDECRAALRGVPASPRPAPEDEPGIDIVPVEELGAALAFDRPFLPHRIRRRALAEFQTEIDETAIFSYIYHNFKPKRHLEIGTWEGHGATVVATACEAEIWTVNLPHGEKDEAGKPAYGIHAADRDKLPAGLRRQLGPGQMATDAGDFIGWKYRAAGFGDRVHQILADSRDLDASAFGPGFFDTVFIDGGHAEDIVTSDTNRLLPLVRPRGLVIWHDFCPDVEALAANEAPRGVVKAITANFDVWRPSLTRLFWIRPSWILVGVKA